MKSIAASSPWLVPCLSMFVVLLAPRAANSQHGSQICGAGSYQIPRNVSTPHLKEIVLGRCWDYQARKFGSDVKWKNCTEISEAFFRAFAFKDPCNLTIADYKPYFDAVGMAVNINKTLFWSGTREAAHSYSDGGLRFTTLEDTMAGWIVNDLTWCVKPKSASSTSDGIDSNSCPRNSSQGEDAFLEQASKMFAQSASGLVRVMLNGSRVNKSGEPIESYRNKSYFARCELPNLNVSKVTKLIVMVVHTIGCKIVEKCGTGSVKLVETLAKERGLTTECVDDPLDVKHMLCMDHPDSKECQFLDGKGSCPATDCGTWTVVISLANVAGVLLVAIVIML